MDNLQTSQTRLATWENIRVILLFLTALGLFCCAGWLFLNKGLYLLPDKMCEGTLERDMVKQVLPRARAAEIGSDRTGAGASLTFWCDVTTSDDVILSGKAQVEPVTRRQWLDHYRGVGKEYKVIRVSAGGVEALAQIDRGDDTASVYVSCAPPGVPEYNASQPYAVVGETYVYRRAKAKGVPLRQALTDFAYQLTKHAYKLAQCKDPRDFPEQLPRYQDQ